VGRGVVGADDGERIFVAEAAQHFGGGEACSASTDDDNGGRIRGERLQSGLSELLADEDFVADFFGTPAGNPIERGSSDGFTGAEIEAGVMPRAAHGIANDQTFGERAVVVAALRAYCEEVVAAAGEDGVFAVDLTEEDGIVGDGGEGSALLQV